MTLVHHLSIKALLLVTQDDCIGTILVAALSGRATSRCCSNHKIEWANRVNKAWQVINAEDFDVIQPSLGDTIGRFCREGRFGMVRQDQFGDAEERGGPNDRTQIVHVADAVEQ